MKTKDKKLIYSFIGAIIFIIIVIAVFSVIKSSNNIYITLYSPVDNYKKVLKVNKGSNINNYLESHDIYGYEFIGWFYDDNLSIKVNDGDIINRNQILKAGYSKIIIKDENGFNSEINNEKFITIKTKNSILTQLELNELLNNNPKYLNLEKTTLEDNLIKEDLFYNNTNLKEIILPESLTLIGDRAFKNCYNLEKIVLGNNVKKISKEAFYNCLKLQEINIDSVEEINDYVFSGCKNLKSIKLGKNLKILQDYVFFDTNINDVTINNLNEFFIIDNNVLYSKDGKILIKAFNNINENISIKKETEVINEYAFYNNLKLKKINFDNSLRTIKKEAFANCENLKEVTFKENNSYEINDGVFKNCYSLKEVKFPVGLKILGNRVFKNCYNLNNIEFNNSTSINIENIKTIGNSCFENCKNLEFFVMPDSVENIGENIFKECYNLKIVTLSSRINKITDNMFFNNYRLSKIVVTSNIKEIGNSSFEGCEKLENITTLSNVTSIGTKAFKNCFNIEEIIFDNIEILKEEIFYNCKNLQSISIKNIKELEKNCFYGCESLISFNIEENVEKIHETSFLECTNLEKFTSKNNEYFSVNDGVLFDKNENVLIIYPQGKKDLTYTIKNSVVNVDCISFYNNTFIEEIKVESGNLNFTSLKGVLYSKDKKELIRYPANKKNKIVEVEDNVEVIKEYAFYKNVNIEQLIISDTVKKIGIGALKNLSSLCLLEIPFIGGNYSENKFLGYIFGSNNYLNNYSYVPETLKEVKVTKDTYISKYCFYDLNNIEIIKYESNITVIDSYAFYNNKNLIEVQMNGVLSNIKEKAFYNVINLKYLTFSFDKNFVIEDNNFNELEYTLTVNVLNGNKHIDYDLRVELKNKFIEINKRAENWLWFF